MLYARINQEYVNEDEIAKKIAFERTLSFVNRLYPDENKEVSLKPSKMNGQLQYGYDTLFQSFRTAVESVITQDFNDQITYEKSNEVVRKYTQLASYLKNIVNLQQLSPQDEEKIKADFSGLLPKLEQLEKIAIDNKFIDRGDITEMVSTIKKTTNTKQMDYRVRHTGSEGMITIIKNKQEAINILNQASVIIQALNVALLGTHPDSATIQNVIDFFENFDTNAMTESDYDTIKNNYNRLLQINDINTDMLKDVQTSMDESKELIKKTVDEAIDFATFSDQPLDIYTHLTQYVLPVLLPGVDPTLEQKQVEQLITDYLIIMDHVDTKNGNTHTDRDILVTDARTEISKLKLLLSKPVDYIASYLAGDIPKYHAKLIDVDKKLMTNLIEKVVAVFNTPTPPPVKIKVVTAPPQTIQPQSKSIQRTRVEFNKKMHDAVTDNIASRAAKTGNMYKNLYITKHRKILKMKKYDADWTYYNGLVETNPMQLKLKENYFDLI
jgi:hypothetical protein